MSAPSLCDGVSLVGSHHLRTRAGPQLPIAVRGIGSPPTLPDAGMPSACETPVWIKRSAA